MTGMVCELADSGILSDNRSFLNDKKIIDFTIYRRMRLEALADDTGQAEAELSALAEAELSALAEAAQAAAERAAAAIDDALAYIEASNRRIAEMEAAARQRGQGAD